MSELLKDLTIFAPAKVNLHLVIKNKRSDGFHNLESLFFAVNFGDSLHFSPTHEENVIEITMKGQSCDVPLRDNIIFKAISLFREKTGFNRGFKITVEKRIPLGSGLGGGSSNAASALLVLNKLAGFPLERESLFELGAALGSDVPFFLHETPAAWVTGRGEHIEAVEAPSLFLTLVNPGFPSHTAAAYRLFDEHREQSKRFYTEETEINRERGELFRWEKFRNDFLDIFPKTEKNIYNTIISSLQNLGAEFAGLSGAGSTCFGVFAKKEQAEKAAESLRKIWKFAQTATNAFV
ncbi:MAG: 4-(cytidine 5'-diphospho)-2-C-methyl-D-erythritol kinase [Treponema sp.]|nr:4-(cytidine 5'-diphospho)-2-C-methyl-D-erythritol kinase [Treponema sp.]